MSRRRTTSPRHLAGVRREDVDSAAADFDVEAAFDPDFDFDALFAADDAEAEAPAAKAGLPRHRIAVAVAVTLAALPLLFLDNFQANASTPARVDASAAHLDLAPTGPPLALDSVATPYVSIAAPTTVTPVTVPPAVVFNAAAAVTAPSTTATTAPPTTTTAKATFAAASASVTTPTTAKPAPTTTVKPTTTTVKPTTTTTRPPAPTTTVAAAAPARPGDPASDASWEALAKCEAGGNWAANTGNGYYGGLQFSLATWQNLGGTGYPHQASKATQIALGKKLYARSGWNAWPGCSAQLGWV